MSFKKDLRRISHPYYLINIFLSLSYVLAKKSPYVCSYLFYNSETKCELDSRESEILFFLIIVVMIRTRKTGSVTMISYLSSSFMYTKVANMILWFYADIKMGLIYSIVFVCFEFDVNEPEMLENSYSQSDCSLDSMTSREDGDPDVTGLFFPEPTYSGPQNVIYFRGLQGLGSELERDKRVNWLVAFYTMWSPSCNNFAPIFAQLSASYDTNFLKFGKVDIGRYPEAGKKYHVSDSPVSRQLPTLILFQNGKEVMRRPTVDSSGKLQKFFFSEDNIRVTFDLNNLYEQSKGKTKVDKKASITDAKKDQ